MKIAAKQIRIIKMAQRDLGIDDDTYREMLRERFGVSSCTRLSIDQANGLIDELQGMGFALRPKKQGWSEVRGGSKARTSGAPRPCGDNVINLAGAEELAKLDAVAALIDWQYEDGLQRFLARRLGLSGGKVRTGRDVYRAIEAVKKLFENGMKKRYGADWWARRHEDPAVMEYIDRHCPEEWR